MENYDNCGFSRCNFGLWGFLGIYDGLMLESKSCVCVNFSISFGGVIFVLKL